jgi:hypothetical protein
MAVGLRLIAKLASPAPEPGKLMNDIAAWLRQKCADVEPEIKLREDSPAIFCRLHPGAEGLELSPSGADHLVASASTSSVGPGYHIYLVSLLKDWARDFQASWPQAENESGEYGDETGYFFSGDEQQVFSSMTLWLQNVARVFFDGRLDPNDTGFALSMSPNSLFESDALAITPLGPRDRAWMLETSQDGAKGKDFFAWWTPGLTADYCLGRALTLMWRTVRWRPPVCEAETEVLKTVAASLAQAYKLNAALPFPWAEWEEILGLLGADAPEKAMVLAHAAGTPTIGYRRGHVTENLTGGWRIRVTGSFSEFDFDKEHNLFAVDPPREIWFTSFRLPAPLPEEKFELAKGQLKESKPNHFEEGHQYAAAATFGKKVRETGEDYFLMNTLNITPSAKAVCTFVYAKAEDKDWALEAWRSLRPPVARKP